MENDKQKSIHNSIEKKLKQMKKPILVVSDDFTYIRDIGTCFFNFYSNMFKIVRENSNRHQ